MKVSRQREGIILEGSHRGDMLGRYISSSSLDVKKKWLPHIDVMVGVHQPLLAVELVPIPAGREDILTGGLRSRTWMEIQ